MAFARILICLLLAAIPAFAATPAYVASSFACAEATATMTISLSVTVGSGQQLFGYVLTSAVDATLSTFNFNSSEAGTLSVYGLSDLSFSQLDYWLSPTATTANVTATSVHNQDWILCVIRTTGVTSVGTGVRASGTTGAPTVACSSATGQVVIDFTVDNNSVGAAGAGQTQLGSDFDGSHHAGASSEAGAASVTMDWADNMNYWWDACIPLIGANSAPPSRRRR